MTLGFLVEMGIGGPAGEQVQQSRWIVSRVLYESRDTHLVMAQYTIYYDTQNKSRDIDGFDTKVQAEVTARSFSENSDGAAR